MEIPQNTYGAKGNKTFSRNKDAKNVIQVSGKKYTLLSWTNKWLGSRIASRLKYHESDDGLKIQNFQNKTVGIEAKRTMEMHWWKNKNKKARPQNTWTS